MLALSDSMLRGVRVGGRFDSDLYVRGGASVRDLTASVYYDNDQFGSRSISVVGYQVILVHVGTNDLSNGRTSVEISLDIKELIDVLRRNNRDAVLVISGILYRPVDDDYSYARVNSTNAAISRVTERFPGVLFLRSHTLFKSGNTLLSQLFDHSGLHLNQAGQGRLGTYLRARLARGSLIRDFTLTKRAVPHVLR